VTVSRRPRHLGRDPPEDGIFERGVLYRFKGRKWPEREADPEVLEVVRRAEQKLIREYYERKKRAS
jgi:hypothetical protein